MVTRKIMKNIVWYCSLYLILFSSGCTGELKNTTKKIITENVMEAGDRITAKNAFGQLTITADERNIRYLTFSGRGTHAVWMGDTVRVKLIERTTRYRGSLGLYCDTNVKKIRIKGGGGEPTNIKMEEAQLHFDTQETAEAWVNLIKFEEEFNPQVWTSEGLYVRWEYVTPEHWFFPKRTYLYVLVFQLYVGGEKIPPHNIGRENKKDQKIFGFPNDTRFWYGGTGFLGDYPEVLDKLEKEPIKTGGHKPSNLPGAQDKKIKVEHLTEKQIKEFKEKIHS